VTAVMSAKMLARELAARLDPGRALRGPGAADSDPTAANGGTALGDAAGGAPEASPANVGACVCVPPGFIIGNIPRETKFRIGSVEDEFPANR